jgi:N-acetylmuramoyl-L-alanine amidase
VVFVSIHADSLHPEIRGAMIYVPGRDHPRGGGAGRTGGELQRSEGLSRALAREALKSLRARGIAVHPFLPIRGHVIRAGRRWVPAVLRATRVPHALLVEVANLGSPADRARIATSAFRQDVAEGIAEALVRYYARVEAPAGPAPEIARGAGAGGGRP